MQLQFYRISFKADGLFILFLFFFTPKGQKKIKLSSNIESIWLQDGSCQGGAASRGRP